MSASRFESRCKGGHSSRPVSRISQQGDLTSIAGRSDGWTGADLTTLARKAKRKARQESRTVVLEDIVSCLPPLITIDREERFRVAVHESGHALTSLALGYAPVRSVTLKSAREASPEAQVAGETEYESPGSVLVTRTSGLRRLAVLMGGAAAEDIIFGEISEFFSSGPRSDLQIALLEEMSRAFFLNAGRKTFEFKAVAESSDILQAIMPEGKFTKYLFDRANEKGKLKAAFLIDDLGIDPEDWRYLAAQFYSGLLIAEPNAVKLNEWKTGYGARFEVPMRIRNRAGKTAVIVTGWNMNPGALPSLSTAYPSPRDAEAIEPGEPPILPPVLRGDAEWSQLWAWANAAGIRAGESHVPTPMFLSGTEAISEGECGTALVRVFGARRGFARWLKRQGLGDTDGYGGWWHSVPFPVNRSTAQMRGRGPWRRSSASMVSRPTSSRLTAKTFDLVRSLLAGRSRAEDVLAHLSL